MSVTTRRLNIRTLLLAAVAMLAFALASPAASQAGEYGFIPCGDDQANLGREWGYKGQQMIGLRASCGKSFYQYFQVPILTEWGGGLRTLPLGPGKIESVNFAVRGRDPSDQGMDFALAMCNGDDFPADCGTQVRGATDAPYFLPRAVTLSQSEGDFVDGAELLTLYATCTLPEGEYCPAGDAVVAFSDLYVVAEDSTEPEVTDVPVFENNEWINYGPGAGMMANDPESGIDQSIVRANGAESYREFCNGPTAAFGCNQTATPYNGTGVPLIQGRNTVSVETRNDADMATETELSFLYDSVKPTHPVNLRALGTEGRWLVGNTLRLHWKNSTEPVQSETESGIVKAIVDLQPSELPPVWGPEQSEHEFTGVGIDSATLSLPFEDTWTVKVSTVDAAGNKSEAEPIIIDNEDSFMSPPTINPEDLPVLNIVGTSGPVTFTWQNGNFGRSGNCGHRGWIGKGTPPTLANNPSSRVADPNETSWTLSQVGISKLSDGDNTLALAGVDCAGDVSSNMLRTVPIDRVRPIPVVDPGSRWLPAGSHLTLSASDPGWPATGSGVKSVWYRIDGGAIVSSPGDEIQIPASAGDHSLEYGATDVLGNPSASTPMKKFGVDGEAPIASIVPAPGGLGSFNAVVSDSVSGVVDAWCEISPSGGSGRSRIGDRFASSEGQTSAVTLGLRVPDDGSLPPGDYDLRVNARDAAGNIQTAIVRSVRLPLRPKSSLSTVIHSASRPKVGRDAITLALGAKAGLRGTLRDSSGTPIGGATLRIVAQRDGGGRRVLGETRTAGDGTYSWPLGTDVSRALNVAYDGDASRGAASASVRQNVRSGVSLKLSSKNVRRGGKLYASGRVSLLSASVPSQGVPFEIQYCGRSACTQLTISRRTDSDGGFSVQIPTSYSSRTKLVLRARVDAFPGWPFAAGSSERRTVVIR